MFHAFSETPKNTLGIVGQGKLLQMLQPYLERFYQVMPITTELSAELISSCALIVSCHDTWSPEALGRINRHCVRVGMALLPVYTYYNLGIIGPCVLPHATGCVTCATFRRLGAIWDDAEYELYRQYASADREMTREQPWLASWNQEVLTQVVLDEIATYFRAPEQVRTRQAQLYFFMDTLKSGLHRFLPASNCPDCANKRPDTPEQAAIALQSRAKPGPFSYHIRDLTTSRENLLNTYADAYLGVIGALFSQNPSAQPHSFSRSRVALGDRWKEMNSMGIATRWNQAQIVAIAEALERHAGQYPHAKQTNVHASFRQLATQSLPALDPTTLGLHNSEQYANPRFPFVPYTHDLVTDWVWGYSFKQKQPLLVPETCVYYGSLLYREAYDAFVYEISNGCALGGSLEEAILYGILEVAERDAFLLTWYARLTLPRLNLKSVTDQPTRLLIRHLEQCSGYTIYAFNATLDHAIPCLWVMAVDEERRPDRPRALCSAGSHPHPELALVKALQELGAMLVPPVNPQTFAREKDQLLKMVNDPSEVQSMTDHSRLYWLPEAFERLSFLYYTLHDQTFQEAFPVFYAHPPSRMDLREDLLMIIDHYLRRRIDIVVVDQTSPEQQLHDFHCVKILMPGTLSMTFGHVFRRTAGCQRLFQVPHLLGYWKRPLTEADLNPHPHPFP